MLEKGTLNWCHLSWIKPQSEESEQKLRAGILLQST